jgi:hypothetical protein
MCGMESIQKLLWAWKTQKMKECGPGQVPHPGLSYRAFGGLLAGEPGGRAGGPVHYALYEPGGVL